jgi:hydroxymethylpyrimidine/phosphomethylpyrimidine kinase
MDRPKVLVVAGYDQSAGAGVLSDIKTLEAHGVYGYAAITGITWQNERLVRRVEWMAVKDVFEQIDVCFESAVFSWVKIGVTESIALAAAIIDHIREHNPQARIVLDPVIKASSGADFWVGLAGTGRGEAERPGGRTTAEWEAERPGGRTTAEWEALAARCYLVTPNLEEIGWLYPGGDVGARCAALTKDRGVNIFLKGGHNQANPGQDQLWMEGEVEVMEAVDGVFWPKHGSGCVLSSALTANLALGYPLPVAAERAKRYIERFLGSNKTLLGWH